MYQPCFYLLFHKASTLEKCNECSVCGGHYYGRLKNDCCAICSEMFEENRRMVTRVDGVVFMVSGSKENRKISRYVVTKFGNLKRIGEPRPILSATVSDSEVTEGTDAVENTEETTAV